MNQWTVLCIAAALSNGILRSGDIAQPMELITSKTRTVLNLCPVELLCVMTVLFCVLRQLGPGLGAGTGCARVLAPDRGPGTKPDLEWRAPVGRYQLCPVIASYLTPSPSLQDASRKMSRQWHREETSPPWWQDERHSWGRWPVQDRPGVSGPGTKLTTRHQSTRLITLTTRWRGRD